MRFIVKKYLNINTGSKRIHAYCRDFDYNKLLPFFSNTYEKRCNLGDRLDLRDLIDFEDSAYD